MDIYPVDPPFSLQVEPTEGCSLACSFCGIASIRDNGANANEGTHGKNSAPYKHMERATLIRLMKEVKRLKWNPRIEFAMHGEPSMHPDLPGLVSATRKILGKSAHIMITSNGSGLTTPEKINALMEAGPNTLALDDYKHAKFMPKIKEFVRTLGHTVFDYPADKNGNPHHRNKGSRIVLINDISENTDGNHQLTNQGGSSFDALTEPLVRRCAKPFRELSVRWDGNVAICCDDWVGAYKIGNTNELPLDEIWLHPRFEAARRRLYAKDRDFGPCKGCNVKTMRDGLLPDKMGKGEMKGVSPASEAHLRAALRGRIFSIKEVKSVA
jgi:radical SAM protein with 4Fe4S-binding SPASM domain